MYTFRTYSKFRCNISLSVDDFPSRLEVTWIAAPLADGPYGPGAHPPAAVRHRTAHGLDCKCSVEFHWNEFWPWMWLFHIVLVSYVCFLLCVSHVKKLKKKNMRATFGSPVYSLNTGDTRGTFPWSQGWNAAPHRRLGWNLSCLGAPHIRGWSYEDSDFGSSWFRTPRVPRFGPWELRIL